MVKRKKDNRTNNYLQKTTSKTTDTWNTEKKNCKPGEKKTIHIVFWRHSAHERTEIRKWKISIWNIPFLAGCNLLNDNTSSYYFDMWHVISGSCYSWIYIYPCSQWQPRLKLWIGFSLIIQSQLVSDLWQVRGFHWIFRLKNCTIKNWSKPYKK
jgi:hypothetical protein